MFQMKSNKENLSFKYHQNEGLHVDHIFSISIQFPVLQIFEKFRRFQLADLIQVVPVGRVCVGEGVELQNLTPFLLQSRVVAKCKGCKNILGKVSLHVNLKR